MTCVLLIPRVIADLMKMSQEESYGFMLHSLDSNGLVWVPHSFAKTVVVTCCEESLCWRMVMLSLS